MTTGHRLFKGENELKTLEKILKEPIPQPSSLVEDYPPELEAIVMRMVSREPDDRYARLADAAKEIQAWLDKTNSGQDKVTEFVAKILGEQLKEVTRDLTPSQENFVINLGDSTSARNDLNATPATMTTVMQIKKRRNTGLIAAGLGGILLLGALAFMLTLDDEEDIPRKRKPVVAQQEEQPGDFASLESYAKSKLSKSASKGPDGKTITLIDLAIGQPEGATVNVDGKDWPEKVPTVVTGLAPGPHEISLTTIDGKKTSYKFASSLADIKNTFEDKSIGDLSAFKKKAKTKFSTRKEKSKKGEITLIDLSIGDPVGATVTVDGKVWKEKVPTVITGLTPGQHEIALTAKDGSKKSFKFQTEKAVSITQIVNFDVTPSNAELKVTQGGKTKTRGADEELDFLKAGKFKVVVSRSGYKSKTLNLSIEKGQQRTETVVLEKRKGGGSSGTSSGNGGRVIVVPGQKPPPPPPDPGFLYINTTPWAKVYIDGKPAGSTPLFKYKLKAGKHKIMLVNDGAGIKTTKTITIKPGKKTKKSYKLQ